MSTNEVVPRVSIGMPVFNAEHSIRSAIDSLLNQTFTEFELIVSDNHSTDGTSTTLRAYAEADKRIKYFRQETNLGATKNFKFVKDQARGEYFMWAAGDDRWGDQFIGRCLECLNTHPAAVGAITNARFGLTLDAGTGADPIASDWEVVRRNKFLLNPGPNARFYSLYRMETIMDLDFGDYHFHAGDWAFIFDLLSKGQLLRVDDYYGFFKDDAGLGSNQAVMARRLRADRVPKWLPLAHLARHVLKRNPITGWIYLPALALANYRNYKYLYA